MADKSSAQAELLKRLKIDDKELPDLVRKLLETEDLHERVRTRHEDFLKKLEQ